MLIFRLEAHSGGSGLLWPDHGAVTRDWQKKTKGGTVPEEAGLLGPDHGVAARDGKWCVYYIVYWGFKTFFEVKI